MQKEAVLAVPPAQSLKCGNKAQAWLRALTEFLARIVASLGGSSIITERLTCTMGTAGMLRISVRKVCD